MAYGKRSRATVHAVRQSGACDVPTYFWFVIGVGVAIFVSIKIRKYLKKRAQRPSANVCPNLRAALATRPATSSTEYERYGRARNGAA
jgi:hypothetical protein